ncbi:MAG: hydantoinase B/oxoprolinase family protein [Alphaproteobacteria bacterium]|jgi:N-methylhydantoinase B|uniref:hydantoinase B/oxoprolinase family protein n=1 Tax=Pacificispira sp. TaxID=2888761 RepID=UPI002EA5ED69|nr:hydantoinase B/oxoprolinase family protein [Pseudomonadota bacterium]
MKISALDYAVISQGVQAAAREMGVKLIRSAYSTILREARDGSAALLDAKGRTIAQAELIPMQLGTIDAIVQPCLELFPPETLQEGDFLINNHPYHGGQHLQDVFIFNPVFFEGKLIGFGASVAHHLDLGGGSAGLNPNASDVYQEGILIPPSKYNMDRDWNGGNFERLIASNIRVPTQTIGDFNAQFAANFMGGGRLKELCTKHGVDAVLETMDEMLNYTERRVRAAIEDLPDGVYTGEDCIDDAAFDGDDPVWIRAKVTVKGDSIDVDFEGTDPQVNCNINCPFASTQSVALSAVKVALTGSDVPFNSGLRRPITFRAPYGSILNPKPPAPVRARMIPAYRAYDAIMKALSKAAPEKVTAMGFDCTTIACLAHKDDNGFAVHIEPYGGGFGGSVDQDGCDAIDNQLSNCANTPVESLDTGYSFFRVKAYSMVMDSFGHGRHRGGAGFLRSYEILKDGATFAIYSDHHKYAPSGLFGGSDGTKGYCRVLRGGEEVIVGSKNLVNLKKGDIVEVFCGGGGGYGDPRERARSDIENDIAEGLLSPGEAARIYALPEAAE